MEKIHVKFALDFWEKHGIKHPPAEIYIVDETAFYFDTSPKKIWAIRGRKGSAKIRKTRKHSARMTAVITARADGKEFYFVLIF
ncbi:hypothetical protein JG688_00018408 [Phytophthora aleatoria]|uniref:Uncharacterized protein n=1 Tax=Phytophthora aleatoria TaxID=2496075 RepID=A0A8J5IFI9_9STRA|nr:hypothetical protein JG688_00018408 [Phytophthora aleatoria]